MSFFRKTDYPIYVLGKGFVTKIHAPTALNFGQSPLSLQNHLQLMRVIGINGRVFIRNHSPADQIR